MNMVLLKPYLLMLFLFISSGVSLRLSKLRPDENSTFFKIFGQPQVTVSKFPPFIEFFVQRIQAHFSTYVHEDLSRPPTWDKPVYTLSPEDQQFLNLSSTPTSEINNNVELINRTSTKPPSTTKVDLEYEEIGNTTEIFFEIINKPDNNKSPDDFEYEELEETTGKLFEIITETTGNTHNNSNNNNKTYVYITPKTSTSKTLSDKDKYEQARNEITDTEVEINISFKIKKKPTDKGFPIPQFNALPNAQIRGPLDFIGNWIQSSEWFPIEINVPDTFASIGSGVGSFATNVGNGFNAFTQNFGNGFQTFTQSVGTNFQNFAQNLSQRFPILAVVVRPNTPARYFVLVPSQNIDNNSGNNEKYIPSQQMENDILEAFP